MRAYLMMTVMAGAIFAAFTALPNRTEAMTISTPAGMAIAVAGQAEQVRWVCGRFGCWWRPWRPNWYGYYGYYPRRHWWGWRRRWWW